MTDSRVSANTANGDVAEAANGRDGSGVLLGLEPTRIEKAGENPSPDEDSNSADCYAPLLGTTLS